MELINVISDHIDWNIVQSLDTSTCLGFPSCDSLNFFGTSLNVMTVELYANKLFKVGTESKKVNILFSYKIRSQ